MLRFRLSLLSVLLVALGACSHFGGGSKKDDPSAEIRAALEAQVAAWNRGDIEGFMKGYWHDDALRFVSGDKETRGWEQNLARYKSRYTTRESMGTLSFSDLDVHLLGEHDAYVFGHWQLKRGKDHPKGLFTLILHESHKGWRVVHDHTSSE